MFWGEGLCNEKGAKYKTKKIEVALNWGISALWLSVLSDFLLFFVHLFPPHLFVCTHSLTLTLPSAEVLVYYSLHEATSTCMVSLVDGLLPTVLQMPVQ